jgi:hypothetical protein
MVKYEARVITQFAEKLYAQAGRVVILYVVVMALGGLAVGKAIGGRDAEGPMVLVALLGGVLGQFVGQARAFLLRLQAQVALCQVEIERNTRKTAEHTAPLLNPVDPP